MLCRHLVGRHAGRTGGMRRLSLVVDEYARSGVEQLAGGRAAPLRLAQAADGVQHGCRIGLLGAVEHAQQVRR